MRRVLKTAVGTMVSFAVIGVAAGTASTPLRGLDP